MTEVPEITVRLLGPLQVDVGGAPIALPPRKGRGLLAYLVVRAGAEVPRDTLLGLFWADRSEAQARASLRQALALVRKSLGDEADRLLRTTRDSVTFARKGVRTDLAALEALGPAATIPELETAVRRSRGELLEGLSIKDAAFELWLTTERERHRLMLSHALKRLAELLREAGRPAEALEQTVSLLALNPLDEATHRSLMQLYITQGRSDAALKQFERCRNLLWEDRRRRTGG